MNGDSGSNPGRTKRWTKTPTESRTEDTAADRNEALEKMNYLIGQTDQEFKRLYKIVMENQNTRKDIKESVYVLSDLVLQLSAPDLKEELEAKQREVAEVRGKGTETREASTQTEHGNQHMGNDVITPEKIKAVSKYEDFVGLKNLSWPQEVYTRSKHVEGIVAQAGKGEDVLVWDEGERDGPQTKSYGEICRPRRD